MEHGQKVWFLKADSNEVPLGAVMEGTYFCKYDQGSSVVKRADGSLLVTLTTHIYADKELAEKDLRLAQDRVVQNCISSFRSYSEACGTFRAFKDRPMPVPLTKLPPPETTIWGVSTSRFRVQRITGARPNMQEDVLMYAIYDGNYYQNVFLTEEDAKTFAYWLVRAVIDNYAFSLGLRGFVEPEETITAVLQRIQEAA